MRGIGTNDDGAVHRPARQADADLPSTSDRVVVREQLAGGPEHDPGAGGHKALIVESRHDIDHA